MNHNTFPQPLRPRAFVVRVVPNAQGQLHGQISEPGSMDEWRATFVEVAELWLLFAERLACPLEPNAKRVRDEKEST
jgi:hypothetical protein